MPPISPAAPARLASLPFRQVARSPKRPASNKRRRPLIDFREGREAGQIKMMEPGKPAQIRVNLGGTANTFEAGHRIAIHITSSNAPRFEVNPNTGEAPGSNKVPPRVAHNTIHHDADHATALVLPVVE